METTQADDRRSKAAVGGGIDSPSWKFYRDRPSSRWNFDYRPYLTPAAVV